MRIMNKINYTSNINFGAKFKNPVEILKKDTTGNYIPYNVSFIELEPDNANDLKALANINQHWGEKGEYTNDIYELALELNSDKDLQNFNRIFAITEQNDKFEKLSNEKILGLAEVSTRKPKEYYISYIQVEPRNVFSTNPEFKMIGTRILDSIKAFANRILLSPSSKDTAEFYLKNDFKPSKFSYSIFEWLKK